MYAPGHERTRNTSVSSRELQHRGSPDFINSVTDEVMADTISWHSRPPGDVPDDALRHAAGQYP